MTLDELMVQKLKVQPNLAGEPAFGYKVVESEMQLNPNAALIEGPKGRLEKLDSVKTEKIDLVGRLRSFRRTAALELPANVKPLSESLIDVYIPIREESAEKNFQDVPVKLLSRSGIGGQMTLTPSVISFVLRGSKSQLGTLVPEKLLAFADASSLGAGEHDIPVQLILPPEVSLKDDAPKVKVAIKK